MRWSPGEPRCPAAGRPGRPGSCRAGEAALQPCPQASSASLRLSGTELLRAPHFLCGAACLLLPCAEADSQAALLFRAVTDAANMGVQWSPLHLCFMQREAWHSRTSHTASLTRHLLEERKTTGKLRGSRPQRTRARGWRGRSLRADYFFSGTV